MDEQPPTHGNALKRKFSRIDDGNNSNNGNYTDNNNDNNNYSEQSKHLKVVRTQSGVVVPEFFALDQQGDEVDDIDDSDKSDVEHAQGPHGEQIQPTQRGGMVWPKPRSESPHCCLKCKAMTGTIEGLAALLDDGGYKHHNWYTIQETAALGCALCTAIWDVTEIQDWDCDDDESITRDEIRIVADFTQLPSPAESELPGHPLQDIQLYSLEVRIPADRERASPAAEIFYLVTFEDDPSSNIVPGRRESKDLSPKVVTQIRGWLDDCLNTHDSCPRSCTPELPRRLIDVGVDNSTLRLHQPQKNEKAQYAALSYCWGSSGQQVTTTTSNVRAHMLALPQNLPKTISDAIEVCRKVGIRYLWIDALCIVQNDGDDKLDQIAKMGSIYKNSTVTIVAASAENVADGFLNGKPHEPRVKLPIFINDFTSGTIYLREQYAEQTDPNDESIFQRAWTLQELILSPQFQPVSETYLEFNINFHGLPVSVFGLVDEGIASRYCEKSREDYLKLDQDEKWSQVISDYSARDLTVFDDRLPALAGIASELVKPWNDIYLAGFWGKTIIKHLGWYRHIPFCIGPPKEKFKGVDCTKRISSPSWSWVSVPYPVLINEVVDPDAKLVDSSVQLVSQISPFGQVKGASITLEARILRAWDLELTLGFTGGPSYPQSYDNRIGLDFKDSKPELCNCRLLYLGDRDITYKGMFLVVEKSTSGIFQRVGYAELNDEIKGWKNLLSLAKRETITIE